jgi:hypothetical protein
VNIPAPSDHGIVGSSTALPSSSASATISFPTQQPFEDTPTTSISTQVIVQADAAKPTHNGRPTGLAIVSILALAAVSGAYLYHYVGGFGALRDGGAGAGAPGGAAGGGAGGRSESSRRRGPSPGPRAGS